MKILNIIAAFLITSTKFSRPLFTTTYYFCWKKRNHIGTLIHNFLWPKDWKKCYFVSSWCYTLSIDSCLTFTFAILISLAAGAQTTMRIFHRTHSPHCCKCVIRQQRMKGSLSQRKRAWAPVREGIWLSNLFIRAFIIQNFWGLALHKMFHILHFVVYDPLTLKRY